MRNNGWALFWLGLKRRRKEVRRLRVMMCLAVFFLAFTLLFQDNMNGYQMEMNYRTYGPWIFRSSMAAFDDNPYLEKCGVITTGGRLFRATPAAAAQDSIIEDEEAAENEDVQIEIRESAPGETQPSLTIPLSRDWQWDTLCYLGCMSAEMAEENYIDLYEGRFPQNDNEIVMELGTLQSLGYSYTLGQKLSFYVSDPPAYPSAEEEEPQKEGEEPREAAEPTRTLHLVSFTLVGTIERYTARWNGGGDLPSAIITQGAYQALLESMEMEGTSFSFYSLRPEYRETDIWRFAVELIESTEASGRYEDEEYVANTSAFYNPFWGNPEMYRDMTIVLIVLSSSIVAYLMASYLGKRRKFFLRLREIGASTDEVWRMAAYECVLSALPAVAVTLAVSYLVSFLAVLAVSLSMGINYFYIFSFRTLLTILFCVVLTLSLSLFAALLIFAGRGVTEKRKGLPRGAARSISRRCRRKTDSKKPYLGLRETLRRRRYINRTQTVFIRLAGILACVVLILCVSRVYDSAYTYAHENDYYSDFSGNVGLGISIRYRVPTEPYINEHGKLKNYETHELDALIYSVRRTIPDAFFIEAAELPGIEKLERFTGDSRRLLSWEGKEDDAFFHKYLNEYINAQNYSQHELDLDLDFAGAFIALNEANLSAIQCYEDAETPWKEHQDDIDKSVGDFNAFSRGEQILVLVDKDFSLINSNRIFRGEAVEQVDYWETLGPSFLPGDTLEIQCGNESVSVTVAGVGGRDTVFVGSAFTILGSDALMEKLAAADGVKGGYNNFRIDLNALSDRENTAKSLTELCVKYGVTYQSHVERLKELQDEVLQSLMTYGFFGAVFIILYLFVRSAIANEQRVQLAEKLRLLRRAGSPVSKLRRDNSWDAFVQSLYLLLALPIYETISMLLTRQELVTGKFFGYYSDFLNRMLFIETEASRYQVTTNAWYVALMYTMEKKNHMAAIIPLALVILAVWYMNGRLRKGDPDND